MLASYTVASRLVSPEPVYMSATLSLSLEQQQFHGLSGPLSTPRADISDTIHTPMSLLLVSGDRLPAAELRI